MSTRLFWSPMAAIASACAALGACSGEPESPVGAAYGGAGGGSAGTISIGPGGAPGGGAGGVAPDAGCAYASVQGELLPTNILFVVDRSGSMNCNLPPITSSAACETKPARADAAQPSKWQIVTGALKDAFTRLPARASVGLSFFNNNDDCGVNSQPSVGVKLLEQPQVNALSSALDSVPAPKGGTPIIGATILAYKHLHQQAQAPGNRFAVVLTDGMESCDASKLDVLRTEIPKALSVNIRTFVIGAPGSEPARALLSQMAFMGGTARRPDCDHAGTTPQSGDCHVDMTETHDFGADLATSLASITGQALTCEFDVPQSPDGSALDLTKVNVHYTRGDGSERDILQDTTKACDGGAQGWQYNADRTKIILCGSVCGEVKADTGAKIDIVLGCSTVVIPA